MLSMDDAKELFKKGNTQFKKAMEFFLLDGYVTEHSRIKKEISELYKHLITIEPDQARVLAMYER
jgi:hypothetical protein